jgi:hypothetical protein
MEIVYVVEIVFAQKDSWPTVEQERLVEVKSQHPFLYSSQTVLPVAAWARAVEMEEGLCPLVAILKWRPW